MSTATSSPTDKMTALAEAHARAMVLALRPDFERISAENARIQVTQNAILARLDIMDTMMSSGGVAPKRSVCAAGAAKKGGKAGGAKKPAGDASKVTNSKLLFR